MKHTLKEISKLRHKPECILNKPMSIMADYSTWMIANFSKLTPNMVTIISLIFMIIGAFLYAKGLFFLGAAAIILRNVLDESDGRLARVKQHTTKIGVYLDNISSYIGEIAVIIALFYLNDLKLIMLLVPLLTLMFFMFPLQSTIVKLMLKEIEPKNYKYFLEFEDARIVALIIIPLVYPFLGNFNFTETTFIIYTAAIISIQQGAWLLYYYKDFKKEFNKTP